MLPLKGHFNLNDYNIIFTALKDYGKNEIKMLSPETRNFINRMYNTAISCGIAKSTSEESKKIIEALGVKVGERLTKEAVKKII